MLIAQKAGQYFDSLVSVSLGWFRTTARRRRAPHTSTAAAQSTVVLSRKLISPSSRGGRARGNEVHPTPILLFTHISLQNSAP